MPSNNNSAFLILPSSLARNSQKLLNQTLSLDLIGLLSHILIYEAISYMIESDANRCVNVYMFIINSYVHVESMFLICTYQHQSLKRLANHSYGSESISYASSTPSLHVSIAFIPTACSNSPESTGLQACHSMRLKIF